MRRIMKVWHRRAGKDQTDLNQTIKAMVLAPFCGTYLYIFPKLIQGRRDLWDAKTSPMTGGFPFRAHFPPDLVMESSETEMQITLRPMPHQRPQEIPDGHGGKKVVGSIFQVMGSDKESRENIRGINAAGVVMSEFSDHDPMVWDEILEPVLLENGGWAAFNLTPKGENHAYRMYLAGLRDPRWHVSLYTIADTRRDAEGEDGGPIITEADIADLRARGVDEETIQQEYYCSFKGYLKGTIFGEVVSRARNERRVGDIPHNPMYPVGVCVDIGLSDHTAVWFYQIVGDAIRFIDYHEDVLKPAPYWAKYLREDKPMYFYGGMRLPWDARFAAGPYFESVGFKGVSYARMATGSVQAGIDLVREQFSRYYFDERRCAIGLDHLQKYRRKWDELERVYKKEPVHNEHSHAADALRTGALAGFGPLEFQENPDALKVLDTFDPRTTFETLPPWRY